MFSSEERRQIERKAIEQALREAWLAQSCPLPLLPTAETWPFPLTRLDETILRILGISPA